MTHPQFDYSVEKAYGIKVPGVRRLTGGGSV